jgi:G3E family GTPase
MDVLILGGFLGSGKTTALMGLARYLVGAAVTDSETRVMILENEVGEVGIDDKYLRAGGFSVSNLFSGCGCCTVSGELISAARVIRDEYDPAWLVVETTGVAYPRNMQENLWHALGVRARVAVLTDAARWERLLLPMNGLLRGQIEGSDAVLVNKTDLVTEGQLEKMERDILAFEPDAKIRRISAIGGVADEVWREVAGI